MAVDGFLNFNTRINTQGFNSGTKQITNGLSSLKGMLGKVGGAIAATFAIKNLVNFGKEAINLASDLQEVQNVVDVSFGSLSGKMEELASKAIETYGISELTAKQTGSTYMAMAKGMTIADDAASDMALTLTGLSADMASFYNKEQSVTATALNSVFTGETETLKQFGIVMTEANLQSFAYTQGINKKISAMSQAEKVQLRYNYVMQQTALAQGDFVRTQDSWANQTRKLSELWSQFSGTVGTVLMQVALPAVRTLNKAMVTLNSIAQSLLDNLAAIFDWDIESSGSAASTYEDVSSAIDGVTDSQNSLNKAAEEYQNQLMGFDKINKLSDNSTSGSSSGTGSSSIPGGTMSATMELGADTSEAEKELSEFASKVKTAWESGDYEGLGSLLAQKVNTALSVFADGIDWESIEETVGGKISGVLQGVNSFVDDVDWSLLAEGISEGIGTALSVTDITLDSLNFKVLGGAISEFIQGIDVSAITSELGSLLSTTVSGAFDFVSGWLQGLDWSEIFTNAYEGVKNFFQNIDWSELASSAAELLGSMLGNVLDLKVSANELVGKIFEDIVAAFGSVGEYFDGKIEEAGGNIILGVWNGITDALSDAGQWIKDNIFTPFLEGFKNAFGIHSPSTEMKTMGGYLIDGLKEGIGDIWAKVEEKFTQMLAKIKEWFKNKKAELSDSWDSFTSVVKDKTAKMKASVATKLADFKASWNKRADLVKSKTAKMKASVATKVADFKASWKKRADIVKDKKASMKLSFAEKVEDIQSAAKKRFDAITEVFKGIPTWFKDTFSTAWQKVKDVFSKGGEVFTNIKDGILNGLKTVINGLIDGINAVIKKPFEGINTALEKIKNISIGGKKPFYEKIKTISIPQIPKLATGTVVPASYGEFLAVLGDNKRETEVVSPLSTIEKAVENVFAKHGSGAETINLTVELDGDVVYRTVVKKNQKNKKMTGVNALA